MKIGIPKALMFQYYYPLWRSLFEHLDCEVVFSDNTAKGMVQEGISASVPEICLPIKIYNAHIKNLMDKGVDYIFCPRFVHIEKDYWMCPKYIGLPELVEATFPDVRLLVAEVDCRREDTCDINVFKPVYKKMGISRGAMKKALSYAEKDWAKFRAYCKQGISLDEAATAVFDNIPPENFKQPKQDITIGLLGYVYNVYDPFISMNIIKKLRDMDVNVVTFDMLEEEDLKKHRPENSRNIFWSFPNKLYYAARVMLEEQNVDGLIHITAFGCGPDSIVGKEIEHDFAHFQKPFMTLRVDEHTGENHLQTRIEAFVDMMKRKNRKDGAKI